MVSCVGLEPGCQEQQWLFCWRVLLWPMHFLNLQHFTQQLVVATHRGEEIWPYIVFFEAQGG